MKMNSVNPECFIRWIPFKRTFVREVFLKFHDVETGQLAKEIDKRGEKEDSLKIDAKTFSLRTGGYFVKTVIAQSENA